MQSILSGDYRSMAPHYPCLAGLLRAGAVIYSLASLQHGWPYLLHVCATCVAISMQITTLMMYQSKVKIRCNFISRKLRRHECGAKENDEEYIDNRSRPQLTPRLHTKEEEKNWASHLRVQVIEEPKSEAFISVCRKPLIEERSGDLAYEKEQETGAHFQ